MRLRAWPFICCTIFALPGLAATGVTRLDHLPFRFEANQGQADPSVRFISRGRGYTLGLTAAGSSLSLIDAERGAIAVIETRIVGANPGVRLEPTDRQSTETNYIRGDNPANWLRNVPSWSRVTYTQVYPGIDLIFYGNSRHLEYDFNVSPGADPAAIELEFSGTRQIHLDPSGDLALDTTAGEVRWQKPVVYQVNGAKRESITGKFILSGRNRVAFRIGPYDRSRALVIDPTLTYVTYLGGSKNEAARAIAVDSAGAAYVAGYTNSPDMPFTAGAYQTAYAGGTVQPLAVRGDAFIAKIDPTGTKVIYNTYLGGRGDDFAQGIAVDAAGEAVVTGYTTSNNFPTKNAYSGTYNGSGGNIYRTLGDAFLTKLNAAGNGLVYSTYFGGFSDDAASAIALDSAGNAYITGITVSQNFPTTPGVLQRQYAGGGGNLTGFQWVPQPSLQTGDAFVAKFDPNGALLFSTLLGGSKDDAAFAIAVDPTNNIYVAGATLSTDYPTTPGAYQTSYHGAGKLFDDEVYVIFGDAFVTKLDPTGSKKVYSTYVGGSRDELAAGIAVDSTGAAYITGFTTSTDFPTTPGAYSRIYKGPNTLSEARNSKTGDVFIAKLSPDGTKLTSSTLVGDIDDEAGAGIALDPAGAIYVTGFTNSGRFPTTADAAQRTFNGLAGSDAAPIGHAFLLKMSADFSTIVYSTFLGGTGNDRGFPGIALGYDGSAYLAGLTGSNNFPVTPSAAQGQFGGSDRSGDPKGDAFVAKISGLFPPVPPPMTPPPVTPPPVTPPPTAPPVIVASVANEASAAQGGIAPGEIVLITGSGMGPVAPAMGTPDPATGLLPTTAGGVSVTFDGAPAPIVSASATQVIAIAPYEIASETTSQMTISFSGQTSAATALTVVPSAPGLFSADSSGSGQALASNSDGSANSGANPANAGDTITLNGTGEGQTNPPGVDGLIPAGASPQPVLPVSVTIGGEAAPVMNYGVTPGQPAGYFQITVQIPSDLGAGDQPVVLTVGAASSQQNVTIALSGN